MTKCIINECQRDSMSDHNWDAMRYQLTQLHFKASHYTCYSNLSWRDKADIERQMGFRQEIYIGLIDNVLLINEYEKIKNKILNDLYKEILNDKEEIKNVCLACNSHDKKEHIKFIEENTEINICKDKARKGLFYSFMYEPETIVVNNAFKYDENHYNKKKIKDNLENF